MIEKKGVKDENKPNRFSFNLLGFVRKIHGEVNFKKVKSALRQELRDQRVKSEV